MPLQIRPPLPSVPPSTTQSLTESPWYLLQLLPRATEQLLLRVLLTWV